MKLAAIGKKAVDISDLSISNEAAFEDDCSAFYQLKRP